MSTWEIIEKQEQILQHNRPRPHLLLFSQRIDPAPSLSALHRGTLRLTESTQCTCFVDGSNRLPF